MFPSSEVWSERKGEKCREKKIWGKVEVWRGPGSSGAGDRGGGVGRLHGMGGPTSNADAGGGAAPGSE